MKSLEQLTRNVAVLNWTGCRDLCPNGITLDSRQVGAGMLFAALRGTQTDGHRFIGQAVEKGATAILCESLPAALPREVTFIQVENGARALAGIASEFYDHPSHTLRLVGITGTNGKTTIATWLWELFEKLGYPSGLISTIRIRIHDEILPVTHTTPDVITLNRILAEMVANGCEHAFMEVSSHAMEQMRVEGIRFTGALFTNLTRDHLDYHPDFSSYLNAKKKLFDTLGADAFALVNRDDKHGSIMLQNCRAGHYTYSIHSASDFHARVVENDFQGTQLEVEGQEVWTRFIGSYNASNLLAVYGAARLLEQPVDEILLHLSGLTPVDGRMETIDLGNRITGIVDYAHTPDALENVLKTLADLQREDSQIITVVGAGGDRDKGKRPQMAAVACRYSSRVVLTSDNPRTEDPEQIIRDMEVGIPTEKQKITLSITARREAIKAAHALARPGDVILVAGKGHETYQEVNGVRDHFDDREELKALNSEHDSRFTTHE